MYAKLIALHCTFLISRKVTHCSKSITLENRLHNTQLLCCAQRCDRLFPIAVCDRCLNVTIGKGKASSREAQPNQLSATARALRSQPRLCYGARPSQHPANPPSPLPVNMLSGRYAARAARVAAPRASIVPSVAVRGYAAPANQSTKPPVPLFGLDGTYASALVRELPIR